MEPYITNVSDLIIGSPVFNNKTNTEEMVFSLSVGINGCPTINGNPCTDYSYIPLTHHRLLFSGFRYSMGFYSYKFTSYYNVTVRERTHFLSRFRDFILSILGVYPSKEYKMHFQKNKRNFSGYDLYVTSNSICWEIEGAKEKEDSYTWICLRRNIRFAHEFFALTKHITL